MNLHRSRQRPDWEYVEPTEWNRWQRIAAKTRGVLTPGNVVSSLGAVGVMHGLYQFSQGNKLIGAAEVAGGFAADAFDGIVADKTGTKSPLGKIVDIVFDKVKIGASLFALHKTGALPEAPVIAVGGQHIANTAFTGIALARGQQMEDMQSEQDGKISVFIQCGGISLAAAGASIEAGTVATTVEFLGSGTAIAGTIIPGLSATAEYARNAFGAVITTNLAQEEI